MVTLRVHFVENGANDSFDVKADTERQAYDDADFQIDTRGLDYGKNSIWTEFV